MLSVLSRCHYHALSYDHGLVVILSYCHAVLVSHITLSVLLSHVLLSLIFSCAVLLYHFGPLYMCSLPFRYRIAGKFGEH